jgi:hypothetical protein
MGYFPLLVYRKRHPRTDRGGSDEPYAGEYHQNSSFPRHDSGPVNGSMFAHLGRGWKFLQHCQSQMYWSGVAGDIECAAAA